MSVWCAAWRRGTGCRRWRLRRRSARSGRRSSATARSSVARTRTSATAPDGRVRRHPRGDLSVSSGSTSTMATLAPRRSSSRAVALPIPPVPPVMRTTLPAQVVGLACHRMPRLGRKEARAVAAQHGHRRGQPPPAEIRLVAGAQTVQLVGVPADVEHAVECLDVDESAQHPAHPVPQLPGLQHFDAIGQDGGCGVGGRHRRTGESDDIAVTGVQRVRNGRA